MASILRPVLAYRVGERERGVWLRRLVRCARVVWGNRAMGREGLAQGRDVVMPVPKSCEFTRLMVGHVAIMVCHPPT